MGTSMLAKYPKALKGMIGVIAHDKNAIEEVSEVTIMARDACLKAKVNRRVGLFSKAFIWKVVSQKSWNTKISSAPMPIIMMKAER